jgi:hypothetical protein
MKKEEIIRMIEEMTVSECPPKENSEYHLGFNHARYAYAEEKLKLIREIERQWNS